MRKKRIVISKSSISAGNKREKADGLLLAFAVRALDNGNETASLTTGKIKKFICETEGYIE